MPQIHGAPLCSRVSVEVRSLRFRSCDEAALLSRGQMSSSRAPPEGVEAILGEKKEDICLNSTGNFEQLADQLMRRESQHRNSNFALCLLLRKQ